MTQMVRRGRHDQTTWALTLAWGCTESTNRRVENTAWLTLLALVALGVWQVVHLRSFFQKRYLIDS